MRFLLVPGNNSLSHVAKCVAVGEELVRRGHEFLIAPSRKHAWLPERLGVACHILPDIQENDESGLPTVEWFRPAGRIMECINAEAELIKHYKPHRVLGVFRFTLKASAHIAGVPFDSFTCGCMTPQSKDVLGFDAGEPGGEAQRIILEGFYRYAGSKACEVLRDLGAGEISDIREMLMGERTFLWDFPEFSSLHERRDMVHVGPVFWDRWPSDEVDMEALLRGDSRLAIITSGTCVAGENVTERLTRLLRELGYRVLVAAGGQTELIDILPDDPGVIGCGFAPLHKILPHASLVVSHGGQMTIFEALKERVPVLVMPLQPEQAHNGVCLERMGCGRRLVPPQPFQGNSRIYLDALGRMSDEEIKSVINGLVENPETETNLSEASGIIRGYRGSETVADMLEGA